MSLRIGILTASDRSARGERSDQTSPALEDEIKTANWTVVRVAVIPDDFQIIRETLIVWADRGELDVILTTGGTGFSPRDNTPEATLAVVERIAPGIAEAMRAQSLQSTPHAMLSRGIAGIRGSVLIINLPGSPKAAVENFKVVRPVLLHAVELLKNDPESEKHH
ncbi:MAG: molybdenum cofactor biosynthesis protein [Chloroflexi bacterium GWB2_49_20]|nr:MAG: molybdenum cofactor biosynthesis protein [Chloroflexi bacterium GWB2_49_20]OGN80003.1 MAG: molybdenum cofactor biosynthesis protein [Chloroflexi bacterium GWC2_49_37]OGN85461.1 MAG: molybdenum cofactor biosynthesis protein [Chloroflexi bacterium GWD2_49_16]HBG74326.1 molybdenum cofactor biosynthesis protein [Anaerolineae bacterium]HCM97064.1 molybdenum cofactor biosynthesis protein [Anaerolineae bacterium]